MDPWLSCETTLDDNVKCDKYQVHAVEETKT